ncbi:hypothetical protein WJX74_007679 [Apatococcus lobatus]|uniref:Saccharopine dehydrogenase NADP binding domain-containing protein n=1 Tax=Apatococcus lobatus TaxID=904363 RepID=A0AAW1RE57_9CHLO
MATPMTQRPHDLVVWGATGVVGKLICEHLARSYTGKLRWAMAGRSQERLAAVRQEMSKTNPACKDVPILCGDVGDQASVDAVVKVSRVVLSTTGPYALMGTPVVDACVRMRTHYCDLTGELPWVRKMHRRYHEEATRSQVKIVNSCGFDSVPSDIGTLLIADYMIKHLGKPLASVELLNGQAYGFVSKGTLSSIYGAVINVPKEEKAANNDPYCLNPPNSKRGPDKPDGFWISYSKAAQAWTAPFIMGPYNTRVVRRTNALLGNFYGDGFRYSERQRVPGPIVGALVSSLFIIFGLLALFPPLKPVWKNLLPRLGGKPTEDTMKNGFWKMQLIGQSAPDSSGKATTVVAQLSDKRDAGYNSTARMILETGLCLLEDDKLKQAGLATGGCLTPASSCGLMLADRLNHADFTFKISTVDGKPI